MRLDEKETKDQIGSTEDNIGGERPFKTRVTKIVMYQKHKCREKITKDNRKRTRFSFIWGNYCFWKTSNEYNQSLLQNIDLFP